MNERRTLLSGERGERDTVPIGTVLNFGYAGSTKDIVLPAGSYILECWGAQGGTGYGTGGRYIPAGKGGYSRGVLTLPQTTQVYIRVGGVGTSANSSNLKTIKEGGHNGGGACPAQVNTSSNTASGAGGGGASDIRIGSTSNYARVIVAGGGGGGGYLNSTTLTPGSGGVGGGTSGGSGLLTENATYGSGGGSQTSGGTCTSGNSNATLGKSGSFGSGGNGGSPTSYTTSSRSYAKGSGGGGGWYGGSGGMTISSSESYPGGGGSGYVYTAETASNYPSGCLLTSDYYLAIAGTFAGDTSFPSVSGSTETGHSGSGYVRITRIAPQTIYDFPYTGSSQTKTLDEGTYRIECWGASGGGYGYSVGGKGGYSVGELTLSEQTNLYVKVGGKGDAGYGSGLLTGGYNGGGRSRAAYDYAAGSGGGASDVRIVQDSIYARVIVAGGGGGGRYYNTSGIVERIGGYGGGSSGGTGQGDATKGGTGGSQTTRGSSYYGTTANSSTYGTLATFGSGGGALNSSNSYVITGGGGGWYGGGYAYQAAAGGGSGYVYTANTASNYPSGCKLNISHYLANAQTKSGSASFPNTTGIANETGHEGNGFVRITKFNNCTVTLHLQMGGEPLEGVTIRSAAPFSLKGRRGEKRGVQIDLLIQTSRLAYIVEVKRRIRIGREIEREIADKVAAFPKRRGVSIRTALVYEGELDEAVVRSGAFDIVLPFSRLLGIEPTSYTTFSS